MITADNLFVLLLALIIDLIIGDPDWFYRRVPHPIVIIGEMIDRLDHSWNRPHYQDSSRKTFGIATLLLILIVSGAVGWIIQLLVHKIPYGFLVEALFASIFLAQKSLYHHVAAVSEGFKIGGIEDARNSVAKIVGRDPSHLDESSVCSAAIESLAENFSDGVVAPVFWYLVAGLPGLLVYKTLNTADSMIGYMTEKHQAFGWATAKLDDFCNFFPARLSAIIIGIAACFIANASGKNALKICVSDAQKHRSLNAGWPEAAFAGALNLQIGGPRYYDSQLVEVAWMGNGQRYIYPSDINRSLRLYCASGITLIITLTLLLLGLLLF